MPIYEYQCLKCKKDHEIIQKFSDKPLKKCPSCGGKLEKKMSLSAFQLKGSGWYKDGYASTSSSEKKEGGASSPASETKSNDAPTSTTTHDAPSPAPSSPEKKESSSKKKSGSRSR